MSYSIVDKETTICPVFAEEEVRIRHPQDSGIDSSETEQLVADLEAAWVSGRIPWIFGAEYRAADAAELSGDVSRVALFLQHDVIISSSSKHLVRYVCRYSNRAQQKRQGSQGVKTSTPTGNATECPFELTFVWDGTCWRSSTKENHWAVVCRTCPPCPFPMICRHGRQVEDAVSEVRTTLEGRTGPGLLAAVVNSDGIHAIDEDTVIRINKMHKRRRLCSRDAETDLNQE